MARKPQLVRDRPDALLFQRPGRFDEGIEEPDVRLPDHPLRRSPPHDLIADGERKCRGVADIPGDPGEHGVQHDDPDGRSFGRCA